MTEKRNILIIEDEAAIAMTISDRLESEGYAASTATDGTTGLQAALSGTWDCVVLDLMLPGKDGISLCRELRDRGVDTPVLMLTAKDQTLDKVKGLKTGADDYLTKPFEMIELIARIEALLRRRHPLGPAATVYPVGHYALDLRRQELRYNGITTPLSTQEFKLLKYFYEHRGEVLDRDELLNAVWGYDQSVYTRTVDVHVAWLRQKLGDSKSQSLIITVRGRGYKLSE